jgi:hypothetical protein
MLNDALVRGQGVKGMTTIGVVGLGAMGGMAALLQVLSEATVTTDRAAAS